jgi:hypothetical protein
MQERADDWQAFAMELWGLSVSKRTPIPERVGKLPDPLEYDTLQFGLMELEAVERQAVIQSVSCYQVTHTKALEILRGY